MMKKREINAFKNSDPEFYLEAQEVTLAKALDSKSVAAEAHCSDIPSLKDPKTNSDKEHWQYDDHGRFSRFGILERKNIKASCPQGQKVKIFGAAWYSRTSTPWPPIRAQASQAKGQSEMDNLPGDNHCEVSTATPALAGVP